MAAKRVDYEKNILEFFHNYCEKREGVDWYNEAHSYCAKLSDKHNIPTFKVAGIVAAFSPMKSWDTNKDITELFLTDGTTKTFKALVKKAYKILESRSPYEVYSILNGDKISSFFMNILNPESGSHVTIDRHALRIAGHSKDTCTKKQYRDVSEAYRNASKELQLLPSQLQAITWVKWRQLK